MIPDHELLQSCFVTASMFRLVSTHKRMTANKAPIISTATSMGGKTAEMMIMVHVTIRQNCKKGSMWRGSTVSTSSWSLEKRLRMRPVGVVSKKLIGLAIIWEMKTINSGSLTAPACYYGFNISSFLQHTRYEKVQWAHIHVWMEGWGSDTPHYTYIPEHGVMEFAAGVQGDPSVEEAFDDGE